MADVRNIRRNGDNIPKKIYRSISGNLQEIKKIYKGINGQAVVVWDLGEKLEGVFITTWNLSSGDFTFPALTEFSAECEIDWDDGSKSEKYSSNNSISHNYENSGNYTITVTGNVTEIISSAFENNSELTGVYMSESKVTYIGMHAFQNCVNLKSIVFGEACVVLQNVCFRGCTSLINVDFTRIKSNFYFEPGIFIECTALTDIVLPQTSEGLITFAATTFYGCSNLVNVCLPVRMTSTGESMFTYCTSLQKLTIPAKVTTVAAHTAWYCSKLKEVIILEDENNTDDLYIREFAFKAHSGDLTIHLPHRTYKLGDYVFRIGESPSNTYATHIIFDGTTEEWNAILRRSSSMCLHYARADITCLRD